MSQIETAEQRFRAAFERLKENRPFLLPLGTPISQNNIAKEAGTDPTALRKARYPALIREIQAWVEIHEQEKTLKKERQKRQQHARLSMAEKIRNIQAQRDHAQSQLISAQRQILELLNENADLRTRLEGLLPQPTLLRR